MALSGEDNVTQYPCDFTFQQLMEWTITKNKVKCELTILKQPYPKDGQFLTLFIVKVPIFVFSTKCIDSWVLEFVVSNSIGNRHWKNYILLDFDFHSLENHEIQEN
jgi:hypothetical protein